MLSFSLQRSVGIGLGILFCGLPLLHAQAASPERLKEVARRGAEVMPFDLDETRHIFTQQEAGGLQQVVVRNPANRTQIGLIRRHLSRIAKEFAQGDFSGPAKIHGKSMRGLAKLRQAQPGKLRIEYRDLPNGAEIEYISDDPIVIDAVHDWFDAQLSDHGRHAMPGHPDHQTPEQTTRPPQNR